MTFQGADYSFQVLPEPLSPEPTFHILREDKIVLDLKAQGDNWVEETTGVSTTFIQALGKAISETGTIISPIGATKP
jgi:hypothetical protein